jgi:hypothetical protein
MKLAEYEEKVFLKTGNEFTYEILELRGGDAD